MMLVLSADTLIRFRSGRILMHTTSSPLPAFETSQPALISWLCRFARPADPEAAVAVLPESDRTGARQAIEQLVRRGILVPADTRGDPDRPAGDYAGQIRNHLRLLARSVYDLSCDVIGLGPEAAESEMLERTGIGLERRLVAALTSIDSLRGELLNLRMPMIRSQLESLGVGADARDLQLHIGCGPGHLAGWINIDVHPAPLSLNLLWGLPFPDRSVRRAFVSHLLEHLFHPRDVRFFLSELRRVMQPGGVVRIVVPDIAQCIAAYAADDESFFSSRRETWTWWPENATRLEDFLAYAGAGAEPAYLFEAHKYGYDFETLSKVLGEAGFECMRRSTYMTSEDPQLRVDDVSDVAKARYGDRFYSLFVEADAPHA